MKKITLLTVTFALLLTLGACDVLPFQDDDPDVIDTAYTEQEMREIIEDLMPESYESVEYDLGSLEEAQTDMLETRSDSVIGISVDGGAGGTGSGVVYKKDGNDFYAVTNYHVLEDYTSIQISYEKNGMLFNTTQSAVAPSISDKIDVLGMDETTDLAVIRFESEDNFYAAEFADSYEISVGQYAFAVGNPLGFTYFGTVTMGVISGLSRYVPDSTLEVPFIQHDASISPGNSGGALFDINGDLIGINNMKIVQDTADNIGFAIPSNTVKRIIEDLEEDGEVTRPYLGISSNAQVSACGQDIGVCLSTVETGGAAEEAGLESGDIITGYQIETWEAMQDVDNFTTLRELILNSTVGDSIRIRYERDGEEFTSDYVELKIHPDDR
ncbi:MAG: S1C family serine protease [Bacillota bacterium]